MYPGSRDFNFKENFEIIGTFTNINITCTMKGEVYIGLKIGPITLFTLKSS